jgi:hypothetical protein
MVTIVEVIDWTIRHDVYCYDLYCGLVNKKMRLGIDVQN